ncbi:flavin monoamine oxidase family protein [Anaeromicrobium sediminis]|uniref:Amine oxidase n=1 Tax=Anaeromicrobium sediminis TaxID=1478221 RepID=A0A267MK81_9FIRM|nr:FAD-dependent oxidoreductase [Anaeromicrobium sediminis]PAB59994.1 amine oxidase [Anaeromicrobium sediminis]
MTKNSSPIQPNNPTVEQRHKLLYYALNNVNRLEDFNNIVDLLSPPPDITRIGSPGQYKGIKVGIIGGGLAGLSSAFELRKLGFDITVFEVSEDRIGGRIYTYYFDEDKKLYGELGAMRIPVSHETAWHYIDLFNLDTRPFIQTNENAYIYTRNIRVRNDPEGKNVMKEIYPEFKLTPWERNRSWQKLIDYGLSTVLSGMRPGLRREILQIKPKYSPQMNYWTAYNQRQVCEEMGLSQGALNLIGSVSPFVGQFFYNSYSEHLIEEYPVNFSFLYEIIGGLVNLPLSFYRNLTSKNPNSYGKIPNKALGKVTWKGGSGVTGIYKCDGSHKVLLKYKNMSLNKTLQESFDYVICTIPFSSLRNVDVNPPFSPRKMEAIRELNYESTQKTLFLCNKRFWEEGGPHEQIVGGGSQTDLSISTVWYPSDHGKCINEHINNNRTCYIESPLDKWTLKEGCSPSEKGVLLASYNFTLDAIRLGNIEDNRRIKIIKNQIEAVHGLKKGDLDSIVEDFKTIQWDREPWYYGGFAYFTPEQKRIFSYAIVKPEYNNRVFFAGEHASEMHAWIQGSLKSAMKAANNLVRHCKRHNKIY